MSAFLAVIIYGIQLLLGMQQYKNDKRELQKKVDNKIPPIEYFDPNLIASNSVHYSGFLVGYMAWGFVICFHLILLILIGLRILYLQIHHIEIVLGIIVPIILIYLLKMVSMTTIGKYLFIQNKEKEKKDDKRALKTLSAYAIFMYFIFFAGKIE